MKPKIFIVDDSVVIRQAYAFLLQRELAMEICGEAATAEEALTLLPGCNPDLVLMDISLSGPMDGIDLLRQLRARYAELPVLVVSGYDAAAYAPHVLQLGAFAYVSKGDTAALMAALQKLPAYQPVTPLTRTQPENHD